MFVNAYKCFICHKSTSGLEYFLFKIIFNVFIFLKKNSKQKAKKAKTIQKQAVHTEVTSALDRALFVFSFRFSAQLSIHF